jgi:hypothetical protein
MATTENQANGCILRISNETLEKQVFEISKYYTGVIRRFVRGTPVIFAAKAAGRDSFIGYGVVDKVEYLWEMTPEEETYAREHGWKMGLTLRNLVKFPKPLPIKETIMVSDKRRGAFLHGAMLGEDQVDSILEAAEELQNVEAA